MKRPRSRSSVLLPGFLAFLVAALGAVTNIATSQGDNFVSWGIAGVLAVAVAGVTVLWERARTGGSEASDQGPLAPQLDPADESDTPTFTLEIGDDGRFVGGEELATDAVVAALDLPAGERRCGFTPVR